MKNNLSVKTIVSATAFLLFSSTIQAAVVNYSFSGVIDSYVYNSAFASDPFSGNLSIGTEFSGAISSNQSINYSSSFAPGTSYNAFYNNTAFANINAGVESFNNTPDTLLPGDDLSQPSAVRVSNDSGVGDYYNFLMYSDYVNPSRASPELDSFPASLVGVDYDSFRRGLSIELTDADGTVFNSSDLPGTLPDLSEFETARFTWYTEVLESIYYCDEFNNCGYVTQNVNVYTFSGDLTTLTTVPLPPAIWLFGAGFVSLLSFCKRRRKAH